MNIMIFSDKQCEKEIIARLKKDVSIIYNCDLKLINENDVHGIIKTLKSVDVCIVSDSSQKDILVSFGVSVQIINYAIFSNTTFVDPTSGFDKGKFDGIIMGMSHSQCGIDEKLLNSNYFKMSAPSMDLFLQYEMLKKLARDNGGILPEISKVIIELPYYIFNYDLSKFGSFVFSKLKYYQIVNTYHHLVDLECFDEIINEYQLFCNLFVEGEIVKAVSGKKRILRNVLKKIYHDYLIISNHDKVWNVDFEDTIQENMSIYSDLIACVNSVCPNSSIEILVMPFNPLFRWSHQKDICRNKERFYEIVGNENKIIDDFCLYSDSRLFDDHCHLNKYGKTKYSEYLSTII